MRTLEITNKISFRRYLQDLISVRGLIFQLAIRDIIVKYKNSLLGIMWALLEPIATLLVFVGIFSVLLRFDTSDQGVPYALLVISGIVCWQFFQLNLSEIGDSLYSNEHILKRVYFPHIALSISASLGIAIEFLILVICFLVMLLFYQIDFTWRALLAIPIIIQVYFIALGPGLCIAALNVKYRDFKHLIPIVLRLGFFLCPIAYPINVIFDQDYGQWFLVLYGLNPMVGAISAFRWAFFGIPVYLPFIISSLLFSLLFLPLGIFVFLKNETKLVDHL